MERSREQKHGRKRKRWRVNSNRIWRRVESRSMEERGKDGEWIVIGCVEE